MARLGIEPRTSDYESSALPTPLEDEAFLKGGILYKPIALRKVTIVYNFGLSECNRVKEAICSLRSKSLKSLPQFR